jgi:CDGSH-type Zn-finger protein
MSEVSDHNLLAFYTQAYNKARQTGGGGRETPHQIAHIQGLKAILDLGGGANGMLEHEKPLRVQPEDGAVAHQRRLGFCSHWLNQGGRRQRIAAMPTFTNVTDAFAAGGLYERAYIAGESRAEELAGPMLTKEENSVHASLAASEGMRALLEDLHEIVGATTPEDLIHLVSALVEAAAAVDESGEALETPDVDRRGPVLPSEPAVLDLEPGNYAWCACGLSQNQPFCDGSHKNTDDTPVLIKLKTKGVVQLCQCKQTSTPPYCDGSHLNVDNAGDV